MPDGAMSGATSAMPASAQVGFYGKLPARGDFLREGLARDFTDAWDGWWQQGLAATQRLAGAAWRDSWLEAPVWRFILPPGLCGAQGVLGLWMPSVDRVGRFFPLTIAATAPDGWTGLVPAMDGFLAAAEAAGRDALEFDLAPDELLRRLRDAFVADTAMADGPDCPAGAACWWTDGDTRVAARTESGAALPTGPGFAGLIDDAWAGATGPDAPA